MEKTEMNVSVKNDFTGLKYFQITNLLQKDANEILRAIFENLLTSVTFR